MKTVVLAVLLLIAVAYIVSGAPVESGIVSGDTPDASVLSGDKMQSGKSLYEDETCLPVNTQTLQLYKIVVCLITSYAMTIGETLVL
jgi:hypothetical protein